MDSLKEAVDERINEYEYIKNFRLLDETISNATNTKFMAFIWRIKEIKSELNKFFQKIMNEYKKYTTNSHYEFENDIEDYFEMKESIRKIDNIFDLGLISDIDIYFSTTLNKFISKIEENLTKNLSKN